MTAQLIDAKSGNHLWADRYDRELDDVGVVQPALIGRGPKHGPARRTQMFVEYPEIEADVMADKVPVSMQLQELVNAGRVDEAWFRGRNSRFL